MTSPLSRSAAGISVWAAVPAVSLLARAATRRVALLRSFNATAGTSRRFTSRTTNTEDTAHHHHHTTHSRGSNFFSAYGAFRRERNANRHRQYMTLSMYLDRLPPGFRELLLWSPLLALLYFTCLSARVYYLEEGEAWYHVLLPRWWRHRADGKDGGAMVRVSSLLQRAPPSSTPTISVTLEASGSPSAASSSTNASEGTGVESMGSIATTTYAFRATGVQDIAVSGGGALLTGSPPVASYHEVRTRHAHESQGAPSPTTVSTPPPEEVHRYGVWGAPLLVIRDPVTQRVVGYTTAG
ncbi:hypothetical protein JKF63_07895 [Porcisia hertigi]|uniref:Uncharacterized protein n=1 Tax=Porcisia hertigi TaxID=2761500 RepID=A0A836LJP9_9TRYP|nr:hypothetical protein JKF63_07895 [Porcisia hertigi]